MFNLVKVILTISFIQTINFTYAAENSKENSGNTTSKKSKQDNKNVEKYKVTGSHIKRIDIEGPSPIVVLDKDYLNSTGATSISDVLKNSSFSSYGSGDGNFTTAYANIHGAGRTNTLVLLDGKRITKNAYYGVVNLNLIPMAAVERIEILKDGASAIYGSDALGGVINIITKKDFNGVELATKWYFPKEDGGRKQQYSWVGGVSNAKGSVLTIMDYSKNEYIFGDQRSWSKDGWNTMGSPGSYRGIKVNADGSSSITDWFPGPNCPQDNITNVGEGDKCKFYFAKYASNTPEIESMGMRTNFSFKINKDISVFSRVGLRRIHSEITMAPSPGMFSLKSKVADTLGPDGGPLPGIEPGSNLKIVYRLKELGNRVLENNKTAIDFLAGVQGTFLDTIDWDISASYGKISNVMWEPEGFGLTSKFEKILEEGKFNPFASEGQRGDLSSAYYQPWSKSHSTQKQIDFNITTEIFDLPAGPVGFAFGLLRAEEDFYTESDSFSREGDVIGNPGGKGSGDRSLSAAYTEFSLPLLANLELQLAGRYDSYSDFGNTFNPKIGVRWQMIDSLLMRFSAGTGFKAPLLQDLYASDSLSFPAIIDAKACQQDKDNGVKDPYSCKTVQTLYETSGNKDLKETKSRLANLGFVYQPHTNFNFGIDGWYLKTTNEVGMILDQMLKADRDGVDVSKYGVELTRNQKGYLEKIKAPELNLSSNEMYGFDIDLEAKTPQFSWGKFKFECKYSHILSDKNEGFPGMGLEESIGQVFMPRWRNNATITYEIATHSIAVVAKSIGGTEKQVKEKGDLPSYTEYDLKYEFKAPWNGTVNLGVNNVLNTLPPKDDSVDQFNFDYNKHDALGQTFYAAYKQNF